MNSKAGAGWIGAAGLAILLAAASFAQSPPANPAKKPIDIGAADAPLAPEQREKLAKAIGAHDYPAERAVLKDAIAKDPQSPRLPALLGRVAFLEGHAADAADYLAQADRLQPLVEGDRLTLALGYGFSRRDGLARRELGKLIKINPRNAEYPYWLGRFDAQSGNHLAVAAAELKSAIDLNPDFLDAYEHLGAAFEALGNLPEAGKVYEEAVRRNRRTSAPIGRPPLILSSLLERTGRLEESESYMREALRYQPSSYLLHYRYGVLLEKRQKDAEAVTELRQSIALLPSYADAYLALSKLYARMRKPEDAAEALVKYRELKEALSKSVR